MFGLFDYVKLGAGALLGACLAWAVAYPLAYSRGDDAGYERAQAENRQADFDQAKERMENDAAVDDMSDADLCALLGGVYRDGACG